MEWSSNPPAGLRAEFYQLILAAVYHADGMWGEATFDLYPRDLPLHHGYMIAAGLEDAIDGILALGLGEAEREWLQRHPVLKNTSTAWWESLKHLKFTGDVWAVPEGTVVFPEEPVIRITAPLVQASLLETELIQLVSFASGVATRASRLVEAADGREVLDFGARRLPGTEAARLGARAAYVGGCAGTTFTPAGVYDNVPLVATLSGTFFATYADEDVALEAFSFHFPDLGFVALPEGEPLEGINRLLARGKPLQIVRIDHRDLISASRLVRRALDGAGQNDVKIMGSGSLDEARITRLARSGAPVDLLAVGRHLSVGAVSPGHSMAYRIAEMWRGPDPEPITRPGAARYPGRKQVVRTAHRDILCLEDESFDMEQRGGTALLEPVVIQGERVRPRATAADARALCARSLATLPQGVRELHLPDTWPVMISDDLSLMTLG